MCLFYKMNKSNSPNYLSSLVHNLLKQPRTIVYVMQQIYDNLLRGHNCITIRLYLLVLDYHYRTIFRLKWENQIRTQILNTGHSRYVDFAYLDTTTYVEVSFHSQHFFSIFLCISTPSMSKTVNTKQRVSRGDFSCPRRIFYYIC